jgi:hypothetical protein
LGKPPPCVRISASHPAAAREKGAKARLGVLVTVVVGHRPIVAGPVLRGTRAV